MRLKVPFYRQTTSLNCGPAALKMVLDYLGDKKGLKDLEQRTGIRKGKGISTIQIATAAASLGHTVDFYSKHILFNKENLKLDFYRKYADTTLVEHSKKLVGDAKKEGVNIQEKILSLEKILEFVTTNSIPIILLDWNVVKGQREKGYQGHFVPVVGYDRQNVYVHNHGFHKPRKFLPIKRQVFDEARKADGTDEDIVVVYRK